LINSYNNNDKIALLTCKASSHTTRLTRIDTNPNKMLVFEPGGKLENPEFKTLWARTRTHPQMMQVQDLNLDHIRGRLHVALPNPHHCFTFG